MRLFMFLDENEDLESIQEISDKSGISYPSVLDAVRMFEDVSYVNVVMKKNKKCITKTQKWYEVRENLINLYDSLDDK